MPSQELLWSWLRFVHSLGLGRRKIETTGCSSLIYLQAGAWCASASPRTCCWDHAGFGFTSTFSSLAGQAQARAAFAAPDLKALTQLTIRGAMGWHFLHPFYKEVEEWSCLGLLWAFTLWAAFAHYRPYPVSVLPKHCLPSMLVTSRVGTYAYVSKYCLTIIV